MKNLKLFYQLFSKKILLGLMLLFVFTCSKSDDFEPIVQDPVSNPDPINNENQFTVDDSGGEFLLSSGASIIIPPGALSKSTEITIESYDKQPISNEYTAALGDIVGGVDLGPDGLNFEEPVTITIPINKPLGPEVSEVKIFYKDNGDSSNSNYPHDYSGWQQTNYVGVVNADRQSVTAQIDHFSKLVVQLNFGSSTLDIIGEAATTLGNNGLGIDLEGYTEYFESNVAGIGDVHSYELPINDDYDYDPDNYKYDEYRVVGIRYELYHDFGDIFENPLIIFHGKRYEESFSFFYNYEGDNMSNDNGIDRQFIYHLFINVYYARTSALDVIEIDVPTVTTSFLTDDEDKVAYAGGEVTHAGEISDNWVELVTERGIYFNGSKIKLGDGVGSFVMELQGLEPQNNYTLRAYAINSAGTGYGEEIRFLLDIDENIYRSVIIGEQEWMAENLKTTNFNDGSSIKHVTDRLEWSSLPGSDHTADYTFYSWYNNELSNKYTYGAIYNYPTIKNGKLCPKGWHIPSREEYLTLTDFVGGWEIAGGKLKAPGTTYWNYPNTGATNEFGFTALPGGYRRGMDRILEDQGDFVKMGEDGVWFTSTLSTNSQTHYYVVGLSYDYEDAGMLISPSGNYGTCVRCIKD